MRIKKQVSHGLEEFDQVAEFEVTEPGLQVGSPDWTRWSPGSGAVLGVPLAVAGRIRYAERARAGS